jgi:hypothetical protein
MFSKTNVTLDNCTLEFAKEFATMAPLLGERPLKANHVAFLSQHIKNGTFASPTWAVVVDAATGRRYRANGQHSSTALASLTPEEFSAAFPSGLLVTVEEFTSQNLDQDGFLIFDLFDHPKSLRSNTDIMGLHRAHHPDLAEVDVNLLVHLGNGLAFFNGSREDGKELAPRERAGYYLDPICRQFALWAAPYHASRHAWLFKKPGVVAEMYNDIVVVDETEAKRFWELVLTESHPDADHETRELSYTLRELAQKQKTVPQARFRKEAAKYFRRFRLSLSKANSVTNVLPFVPTESTEQPSA